MSGLSFFWHLAVGLSCLLANEGSASYCIGAAGVGVAHCP